MRESASVERILAWIAAAAFVLASLLLLGLRLDVFASPPAIPDGTDLPTRLLASVDVGQRIWPFDAASTLLYAVAFGSVGLLGWVIRDDGATPRSGGLGSGLFVVGGLAGVAGELVYGGARQVTIDTAYCDCGFKVQESISQFWAMNLAIGAQTWLVDAGILLLALGVVVAARTWLVAAGDAWLRQIGFLAALVGVIGVVLDLTGIGGDVAVYLEALAGGILLPIWIVLFARRADGPSAA